MAFYRSLARRLSQLSSNERRILLALVVCAGAIWAFVKIGSEVIYEREDALDQSLLMMLRSSANPEIPVGPIWLQAWARDITSLGSTAVLTLAVLGVVLFLLLLRKWRPAFQVAAATLGGTLLVNQLKQFFSRQRPEIVPAVADLHTLSFPSGHATMSAIMYLTLAALLGRIVPNRAAKTYVMAAAVSVTLLVGLSRIYLGVHWPSDVLAGWVLGAAWALLCWAAAEWIETRRKS